MFFLGRNSYIYYRLFNNLSLSAEDYVKKFAKFKNFKIKEGKKELITYIAEKIAVEELILQIIYENQFCYVVQPTKLVKEALIKANVQAGSQAESISKTNENISSVAVCSLGSQAESISKTNEVKINVEVYIE